MQMPIGWVARYAGGIVPWLRAIFLGEGTDDRLERETRSNCERALGHTLWSARSSNNNIYKYNKIYLRLSTTTFTPSTTQHLYNPGTSITPRRRASSSRDEIARSRSTL